MSGSTNYIERLTTEVEQMKGKHRRLGEALRAKQQKLHQQLERTRKGMPLADHRGSGRT